MRTTVYLKFGDESLPSGLYVQEVSYDDDFYTPPSVWDIISKEEYDIIKKRMDDPDELKGSHGIVNQEGYEKYRAIVQKQEENWENVKRKEEEEIEKKITLSVKKIKKLLQLGVIEESDIDTEIDQENMSEYREEIKKRLNQN